MFKVQVFNINGELCYINDYEDTTYIGIIYRDIQNIFPFDDFKLCFDNIIIPLYKKLDELGNNNIELTITKYNNNTKINNYLLMFNKNNELIYIKSTKSNDLIMINKNNELNYIKSAKNNYKELIYNILPNIIPLKLISYRETIIILTIHKELYWFTTENPQDIIKYDNIKNINNIFEKKSDEIIITDNDNNIFIIHLNTHYEKQPINIKNNLILTNIKNINDILNIELVYLKKTKYYIIVYINNYIEIYDSNNINIINYKNIKEIILDYNILFLITLDNKIISFIEKYQTIFTKYGFIKIVSVKIYNCNEIIGILDNNDIIIIRIHFYDNIEIILLNNNDIIKNIVEIKILYNNYAFINDIGDIMIIDYDIDNIMEDNIMEDNIMDFITMKDIIVSSETYKYKYDYNITISSSIIRMKLCLILGRNIINIINNEYDIYCAISSNNVGYIIEPLFIEKIINNIKDIILTRLFIVAITYDLKIIINSIDSWYEKRVEKLQHKLNSYNIKKIIGLTKSIIIITVDNKVIQFGLELEYYKEDKITSRIFFDEITQIITC